MALDPGPEHADSGVGREPVVNRSRGAPFRLRRLGSYLIEGQARLGARAAGTFARGLIVET